MEGVELLQRENGHVLCLQLIGKIRVNELRLFNGGGVISIADGRLFTLLVHSSCRGDRDAVLRFSAEEWGRWMRS